MAEKLANKKCAHCGKVIPAPYSLRYDPNWERRKYCNDACRRAGNRRDAVDARNARRRARRAEAKAARSQEAKKRLALMDERMSPKGSESRRLWSLVAELHPDFLPMLALGSDTANNYDPVFMMDRSINS